MGRLRGEILAEAAYTGFQPGDWTVLIPVPLHVRRLRERTFNQSVLLARALSGRFGIPVDVLSLKRRRDTTPQVALGRAGAGPISRGPSRLPRRTGWRDSGLLVDDVYTPAIP
jgi:predicted amidophosphoribosyltransferase